jgi:DNA-binding transcriptional regulator YiaG
LKANAMTEIPELTARHFDRAIPSSQRLRLMRGDFRSGDDVADLRRFLGMTQAQLARAMGISVHSLRNWEQGRRRPKGPAAALLRIAARHPRIIRESLRASDHLEAARRRARREEVEALATMQGLELNDDEVTAGAWRQ